MLFDDSLLTTIHVMDIEPHPDNPRKDLGDLEELTESIKKNGIMQNLTVVPVDEDNPVKYICLIGHRRLAAAKAAGVYQVPARIVFGLSHKDQVGIMLEENMQRNDLTIVEQAQGFQMMLDLGETEESIAEKTGFSRTTVRHRLQLAKLDQKELKRRQEDESFQLSLKDLYALEKVKDIRKRNEILKTAYSSNEIRRKAENAERDEKREQAAAVILEKLKQYNVKKIPAKYDGNWSWIGKFEKIKEFSLEDIKEKYTLQLEEGEQAYYTVSYGLLTIIVPKRKTNKDIQEDERKSDLNRRITGMRQITKQMAEERRRFVKGITEKKYKEPDDLPKVEKMLWGMALSKYCSIDWSNNYKYLTGDDAWNLANEEKEKVLDEMINMPPCNLILLTVAKSVENEAMMDYRGKYMQKEAKRLMEFYNILRLYGYQMSKEEQQIVGGTHELYLNEAE